MLGICALALTSASAVAVPVDYDWDGLASQSWTAIPNNWVQAGYPGLNQADDTATIDDGSTRATVVVEELVPYDVALVFVDAETANCDLMLKIHTADPNDPNNPAYLKVHTTSNPGHTRLMAGSHEEEEEDATVADDATLWIYEGTLDTDAITFHGCSVSSLGHAKGYFDVDMTVRGTGNNGSWDTWVQGYVDWSIAGDPNTGDVTITMKDLKLDGLNGAHLTVTGNGPDVSALDTSSFASNGQWMSLTAVRWDN